MTKLKPSLYGHYGVLLFSIFSEWQEYLNDKKGMIPLTAKPVLERVFVSFYTAIIDPEKSISASTMAEIPTEYIDNSKVMAKMSSIIDSLADDQDYMEMLTHSAKSIVEDGSTSEIDYVQSKLNGLITACRLSQSFLPGIGYSSIGNNILSFMHQYRSSLIK